MRGSSCTPASTFDSGEHSPKSLLEPQLCCSSSRGCTDQQFLPKKTPQHKQCWHCPAPWVQCHGGILLPKAGRGAQPWVSVPSGPTQELLVLQENDIREPKFCINIQPTPSLPVLVFNSLKPSQACSTLLQVRPSATVLLTQLLLPPALTPSMSSPAFFQPLL